MSRDDKRILKARVDGDISFEQMDAADKRITANEIMVVVSAYTGCATPSTKAYLDIVLDTIVDFFQDEYPELNYQEIVLSLKLNLTGSLHVNGDVVNNMATNFNIAFISKILWRYACKRRTIDGVIKNKIDGCEY